MVDADLCLSGFASSTGHASSSLGRRKVDGWFRARSYSHFDNARTYEQALAYVSEPVKVVRHSFMPFLTFDKKQRKFSVAPEEKLPAPSTKSRSLAVPSHVDGYIFSWYAHRLSEQYETLIASLGLDESVLAYRPGGDYVAKMAARAFADVASRPGCLVVALDVEKFFPSIDHAALKTAWSRVIQQRSLPSDHHAVFRAVTRHAGVDRDACLAALGIDPKSDDLPRPLCSGPRFRQLVRDAGLIKTNSNRHGIPQGCQLSSVLSNIAMLRFDETMRLAATAFGGTYRRYSDDILFIVGPEVSARDIVDRVQSALAQMGPTLKLHSSKTEIVAFLRGADGQLRPSNPNGFQYLGFTFDGRRVLIRSSTVSKYVRRCTYAFRKARKAAAATGTKVYRRSVLRRFSPLGKNNFLSRHIRLSQSVMPGDDIQRQFRRQVRRVLSASVASRQRKNLLKDGAVASAVTENCDHGQESVQWQT